VFSHDILAAALEIRPSEAIRALVDEVVAFERGRGEIAS
jgi:hypothetical protein